MENPGGAQMLDEPPTFWRSRGPTPTACAATGRRTALLMARRYGVRVVINSDAHAVEEMGLPGVGVYLARRGWLETDDVANTRPLTLFRRLLNR